MSTPDVSVIVVSWRTRELTLACLASIAKSAAADAVSVECVLVDNASDDGTVQAVRAAHPDVEVVTSSVNVGFAAAGNIGARCARGRILLFLNSDAALERGALAALVDAIDATPHAGAVGCRLVGNNGEEQFSCGRFLTAFNQPAEILGIARGRSYELARLEGKLPEVDWVVGACLAVRNEAFEAVEGFDERFFMYSEDEDLCFRLRQSGWTVHLLNSVRVSHVGGASASVDLPRFRSSIRASQIAFLRKHRGAVSAVAFRVASSIAALKPSARSGIVGWGRG